MKKFTIFSKPALLAILCFSLTIAIFTPLLGQTPLFYGVTQSGGINSLGTIITFNPATNAENVVSSLSLGGAEPSGSLIYDPGTELFYGMTTVGGNNAVGTIITFNPFTNAENVVWSFGSGTDGANPYGNLVYDSNNGLFYGMTSGGGNNSKGAIISFNPSTNAENVVWSFGNGTDGAKPYGDLIYDANNGLFYGLTWQGGSNNYGAIINFNPTTNADSVVWNFSTAGTDGFYPQGNLVYNSNNGLFYGMTIGGGSNFGLGGCIFTFNPSTNAENVVWTFGSVTNDGQEPYGSLVFNASNGLYYGMTSSGGSFGTNGTGTIFSYNPATNSENVVWNFGSLGDGATPYGNLTYDTSNGLFYGMTSVGGVGNLGAIINFNPSTNAENVVWSFASGTDGAHPRGSLGLYTIVCPTITLSSNQVGTLSVQVNASGGIAPYTYHWNNGDTSATQTELTAGTYTDTVIVTDNNGCQAGGIVTFTSSGCPPITVTANQLSDSSADASASGGVVPYSYKWSNNQVTDTATGLTVGSTYTVTATDHNGCTGTGSITITSCPAITVTIDQLSASSADVAAAGGTGPYTYKWSNNQTGDTATSLSAGTYTVTATDLNGCTGTTSATIAGIGNIAAGISSCHVYPNPSNGIFSISVSLVKTSDINISVTDVIGQNIYESSDRTLKELTKQMNLGNLPSGIYIVNVKTDNGSVNRRVVIR